MIPVLENIPNLWNKTFPNPVNFSFMYAKFSRIYILCISFHPEQWVQRNLHMNIEKSIAYHMSLEEDPAIWWQKDQRWTLNSELW